MEGGGGGEGRRRTKEERDKQLPEGTGHTDLSLPQWILHKRGDISLPRSHSWNWEEPYLASHTHKNTTSSACTGTGRWSSEQWSHGPESTQKLTGAKKQRWLQLFCSLFTHP